MSHHWVDQTRGERRERKVEKRKKRMHQGKLVKLLHRLTMQRAGVPETLKPPD